MTMRDDGMLRRLGNSLMKSMAAPGLKDIVEGTLETAIDAALRDGLLKDVLIVGLAMSIAEFGNGIADRMLARKIERFMREVAELSADERSKAISDLAGSERSQEQLGEIIIDMLDKSDPTFKPRILAKLFVAMGRNLYPSEDYFRLATMVNGVYSDDLVKLASTRDPTSLEEGRRFTLQANGFLCSRIETIYAGGGGTMSWSITKDGSMVLDYGFSFPTESK